MALHTLRTLFLLPALVAAATTPYTVGQQVQTSSGAVTGFSSNYATDVSEYRGIRYGESTAGANRFMAPKRYSSNSTIDGRSFADGCPSTFSVPYVFSMSEDCLHLNVFTKPQVGEKSKAVMVWIYGGGFSTGDSATPVYIGSKLAESQDVVVVTINYRLNVFGFAGAPTLPDQNVGLLDQRLAVEWVRDNIAGFGGDPKRITIFGESAGSMSVDYYSYAWLQDPIVNGFISQSGTAMVIDQDYDYKKLIGLRTNSWQAFVEKLGCKGRETGTDVVACTQQKSWQDVLAAMPENKGQANVFSTGFGPIPDGKILPYDFFTEAKSGKLVLKPMLVGNNHNESQLFKTIAKLGNTEFPDATAVSLDKFFTCGAAEAAKARIRNGVPVWRYHLADNKAGTTDGAPHAGDIPYVFGIGGRYSGPLLSTLGAANLPDLVPVVQDAWGAFARDPQNGLTKLGWPKYDPNGDTLIRLGYNGVPKADFVKSTLYDDNCPPSKF